MHLFEHEGKALFQTYDIPIPHGVRFLRDKPVDHTLFSSLSTPLVIKAQVLSGKRDSEGGIVFVDTKEEVVQAAQRLFDREIFGQHVQEAYIEERILGTVLHYLSISYDVPRKEVVLLYSREGGGAIEDVAPDGIVRFPLSVRNTLLPAQVPAYFSLHSPSAAASLTKIAQSLYTLFLSEDALSVEINPIIERPDGTCVAVDAKISLDDAGAARHPDRSYLYRTMMRRPPTERERAAALIDTGEWYYRGTAGTYIELDGTIAVLFSGGGASIANMDILYASGCAPANYTEYSGNPPREKVAALARIVLSKPDLTGLWICGGVANFTNIEETFLGIIDVLDEIKPSYPIVVRRAGPHDEEGFALLRACAQRNGLTLHLYGKDVSMEESIRPFLSE